VERALIARITEDLFIRLSAEKCDPWDCMLRASRARAVLQYPDLLDLKLKSAGHDEWLLSGEAYASLSLRACARLSEEHHLHLEEKHGLN
jgi:hypothetical protein